MSLLTDYGFILLVLACIFGFFMAWGVGANDVANAMGTSVGSRALTIKQAIIIAMIFEFCGAYLAGGEVTETIKNGIVDIDVMTADLLVLGMMSALLAAGTWLLIATSKGWPVSTTHTIIGAVVGFAAFGCSFCWFVRFSFFSFANSYTSSPSLSLLQLLRHFERFVS